MGEVSVVSNPSQNIQAVGQNQGKGQQKNGDDDSSLFAMLLQGLTIMTPNQPLPDTVKNADMNKMLVDTIKEIVSGSEQPTEDLISWFKGLNQGEQSQVFELLTSLIESNTPGLAKQLFGSEGPEIAAFLENNDAVKGFVDFFKDKFIGNNNKQNEIQPKEAVSNLADDEEKVKQQLSTDNKNKISLDNNKNQKPVSSTINTEENQKQQEQNKIVFKTHEVQPKPQTQVNILSQNDTKNEHTVRQDVEVKSLDLNNLQMQHTSFQVTSKTTQVQVTSQQEVQQMNVNQNFTEELGKVLVKNVKLPSGVSETKIQLNPKELGQLNIKLITDKGQITAQIIAENHLGKELLEGQIHHLKQSLIQHGYQVERIDVQQATSSSSSTLDYNQKNGFNFSDQQQSQKQFSNRNNSNGYSLSTNEEVEEFSREILSASGIDYTV